MLYIVQLRDRDAHIQQLNVHLAQSQADKQVHTLLTFGLLTYDPLDLADLS